MHLCDASSMWQYLTPWDGDLSHNFSNWHFHIRLKMPVGKVTFFLGIHTLQLSFAASKYLLSIVNMSKRAGLELEIEMMSK